MHLIGAGTAPDVAGVTALQRQAGNRAVADLLHTGTTGARRRPGPAVQRQTPVATVPTAQTDVDGLMWSWKTISALFVDLREDGRALLGEAEAVGGDKGRRRVAKERGKFEAAIATMDADLAEALRQTAVCQQEISLGVRAAQDKLPALQLAVTQALTTLIRRFMDGAKLAHSFHDRARANLFTSMARQAQQAGGVLPAGGGTATDSTTKGDVATATAVLDTLNNAGPGLLGGGFGMYEAAVAPLTPLGSVFGGFGAGLGVVFGSIGMALGIKASIRGASSERELKALGPTLGSSEMRDATAYAAHKKGKKQLGGAAAGVAGALGLTAGVVGLVALSVATLGVGAAVLGIAAAVVGLGFLIGKYIHRRRKRAKFAEALAHGLVDAANDGSDAAAQKAACDELDARGFDRTALGTDQETAETAKLASVFAQEGANRRADIAATVYRALVGDDVADQVDAERVVEALHIKPGKLRALPADVAKAKIGSKMASW
jgi:hypothetical protein